jgi:3'5'-cyclic nucleotide phosphodiesterase
LKSYDRTALETAELLAAAKKSSWFIPRDNLVDAKGMGEIQTYWLHPNQAESNLKELADNETVAQHWFDPPVNGVRDNLVDAKGMGEIQTYWLHPNQAESNLKELADNETVAQHWFDPPVNGVRTTDALRAHLSEQNQRLAEWNSHQLLRLLNRIVKQRNIRNALTQASGDGAEDVSVENIHMDWNVAGMRVLDEVKDSIPMPSFEPLLFPKSLDNDFDELPEIVVQQLHDFVAIICSMYNKYLPFSNYQHASHVTMGVVKLLSRVCEGTTDVRESRPDTPRSSATSVAAATEAELYEKSFGIAADPMAQFSIAFAALICDVDHPGVTNEQLVREGSRLARVYKNASIAEQNSFSTAWDLLMDPMFHELRSTIYSCQQEFDHFRQVLVNGEFCISCYFSAFLLPCNYSSYLCELGRFSPCRPNSRHGDGSVQ